MIKAPGLGALNLCRKWSNITTLKNHCYPRWAPRCSESLDTLSCVNTAALRLYWWALGEETSGWIVYIPNSFDVVCSSLMLWNAFPGASKHPSTRVPPTTFRNQTKLHLYTNGDFKTSADCSWSGRFLGDDGHLSREIHPEQRPKWQS